MKRQYDSVIIGAGLSGLTAAYFLSKKVKNILIIEKENTIGGRTSTISYKGHRFDTGAVYIVYLGDSLREMIAEMPGKERNLIEIRKNVGYYYEKKMHEIDFSNPLSLIWTLRKFRLLPKNINLLKFGKESISSFRKIRKGYNFLSERGQVSGRKFLEKYFESKTINEVFEPISETFLFSSLDKVSENITKVLLGAFMDPTNKLFHLKNGMGSLIVTMRRNLQRNNIEIKTDISAKKISKEKNGYIVFTNHGTIKTKTIISSIPNPNLHKIIRISKSNQVKYQPIIGCTIGLKKPITTIGKNHLVFIDKEENQPLILIGEKYFKNKHIVPSGKGQLYIIIGTEQSKKLMKTSSKKIEKKIDSVLIKILGKEYTDKKIFSKIYKWKNAFPLANNKYFAKKKATENGIFICGDSKYIGVDGVVLSGKEAALETCEYLNNLT